MTVKALPSSLQKCATATNSPLTLQCVITRAGLGKWLIECAVSHPELQGLRRWLLGTRDAHGLYHQFGFTPLKRPEIFMEIHDPAVYRTAKQR